MISKHNFFKLHKLNLEKEKNRIEQTLNDLILPFLLHTKKLVEPMNERVWEKTLVRDRHWGVVVKPYPASTENSSKAREFYNELLDLLKIHIVSMNSRNELARFINKEILKIINIKQELTTKYSNAWDGQKYIQIRVDAEPEEQMRNIEIWYGRFTRALNEIKTNHENSVTYGP